MNVHLKQLDGLAIMGYGDSKHLVAMDSPEELGGLAAGSRPMELILMGIAGCSAMDIIAILRKKRVPFTDFQTEAKSERADEHPQKFTKIALHYIIKGKGVQAKDVQRSIDLTDERYCGAIEMIRHSVEVTHTFDIIEE